MIIYIFLLMITLLSWKLDQGKSYRLKRIPFVFMALVCGLRYNVGRDYNNYVNMFGYIIHGTHAKVEILYKLLVLFVNRIGGTQQLVFLIMSSLTCFFYYHFIKDQSDNFYLSTLIYLCIGPYYFSSFNTIREALAIGIFLYSLKFINQNKKIILFFFWVLIGTFIHTSMIFVIVIWIVHKIIHNNQFLGCIVLCGFGIGICDSGLINRVLLGMFNGGYVRYIDVYHQSMDLSYVVFLLIAVVILVMESFDVVKIDEFVLTMNTISIVFIGIALVTGSYTMLLTRLASFVTPIFIILIPAIINGFVQKRFVEKTIIMVCIAYYLILVSTNEDLMIYHMSLSLFNIK